MNEEADSGADAHGVLDAAAELLGSDRVERYGAAGSSGASELGTNTGGFRPRRMHGVVRPGTAAQAREVVELFSSYVRAPGLHPFSTGYNWGLGSRDSATDDVVAFDLGELDEVRELDVANGWAVIEPAVTQGTLAGAVADTGRMLSVTTSSARTSVLGNALERGVTLRGQRVEDLVGLEVVLADGARVRVGWWPAETERTAVYPHGRGPGLLQLFAQSNLGIVTAGVVKLRPRPESLRVIRLTFRPDRLGEFCALARYWVAQGLTSGVPKVFDPAAAVDYGAADGVFMTHIPLDGAREKVDGLVGIITRQARASGLFDEISANDSDDTASPHHAVTQLAERAYLGDPDVSDAIFEARMGMGAEDLDERLGLLFFLPMVPFTPEALVHAQELAASIVDETGVAITCTHHLLGPDHVDFVVAVRFARTEARQTDAHRALDLLHERFVAAGFLPYRIDVDHHEWLDRCGTDPAAQALVRHLKSVLDPTGVIAPGRYY